MVLGKLTIHLQKNEIGFLPKTDTKMNSKWIKDLNVRPQTKQKLHNIGFGNDFLDMIPKAQATMTSTNIDKLDFVRIIVLCIKRASQVALVVKNPPASAGDIRDLGWKDTREEGMATHSSILAWRIPWTEEPGGLQSTGSQRVGHK